MKRLLSRSISLLLTIAMLATLMLPAAAAVTDDQLQNPPDYGDTTLENDLDGSGDFEPGADDPSADDPSADDPSADDPSADDPSADDPSADDPSADDPSTDGPSTDDPGADNPEADDPDVDDITVDGSDIAPQSNTPLAIPGYTQVTDASYLLAGNNYLIVAQGENGDLYALYPRALSGNPNKPGNLPSSEQYGPRVAKLTINGSTVTAKATVDTADSSDDVNQDVQMADLCTTFIPFGGGYYHIASASTPTLYLAMDGSNMFSTTANNVEVSAAQTGSFTFHATYGNGSNRYLVFSEYGTDYEFTNNKNVTFGTDFWGPSAQQGAPVYIFVEGDSLPAPSITFKDPADCTPGSTPMYFSKAGGTSGKGWEFSESTTYAALTFADSATNRPISSVTADTTFKIGFSDSYLAAPFQITGTGNYSTAQGKISDASSFTLTVGTDGSYRIQGVNGNNSGWMTQENGNFYLNGVDWKGVKFDTTGSGAEFFIARVPGQSNQYYIWYEKPAEPVVKTPINFKTPAEDNGMVPYYLTKASGNGWKFSPTPYAVTIRDKNKQNVTTTLYVEDQYQIYGGNKYLGIFTPSATGKPSAGDSSSAGTLLSFTLAGNSSDSFTIGSGSNFMTSTVKDITHNGNPWTVIEFGTPGKEFYISQADQSGAYYIWYLDTLGPGAAIAGMFDTSPDNTWVFTGGKDVEGGWEQTQGHRNFMGQFEEYIRWENAKDTENASNPSELRQRYTVNTAHEDLTLAEIVDDAGWAKYVTNFNPRAAVYMVGAEDQSDSDFQTHLSTFISKSLALRNNNGFAVIIKSWDSASLSAQNSAVDAALVQFTDQQSRIVEWE